MDHHRITSRERTFEDTLDAHTLRGLRVIAHNGEVVGRVSQVRINPTTHSVEAIVVSRGLLAKPLYIGASYLSRLSKESILLTMYPAMLLKGRKVLDAHGKSLGRVKEVTRKEHTNTINELIVRSFWRRETRIKPADVKIFGESIILKTHNVKKHPVQRTH